MAQNDKIFTKFTLFVAIVTCLNFSKSFKQAISDITRGYIESFDAFSLNGVYKMPPGECYVALDENQINCGPLFLVSAVRVRVEDADNAEIELAPAPWRAAVQRSLAACAGADAATARVALYLACAPISHYGQQRSIDAQTQQFDMSYYDSD